MFLQVFVYLVGIWFKNTNLIIKKKNIIIWLTKKNYKFIKEQETLFLA